MIPVVTAEEMRALDAAASVPSHVLMERAGTAVARAAIDVMGGTYGRRVAVVAGPGNNGADGLVAVRRLARKGVRVNVIAADKCPSFLHGYDLVIDAAYGTGFHGTWDAPDVGDTPVLAVDIPTGIDAATGEDRGALTAARTVTFAALKAGLLFGAGYEKSGHVEVADIGVDVSGVSRGLVTAADVRATLPIHRRDGHKWMAAVALVAGAPGMTGAAALAARAAMRAGAGMVRLCMPGLDLASLPPSEVVALSVPDRDWEADVMQVVDRCAALVLGPGLGDAAETLTPARAVLANAGVPVVLDGDGLRCLGSPYEAGELLRSRSFPCVLTPHDGEFQRLTGLDAPADRVKATSEWSSRLGATLLLKGPTTVIASPDGSTLLVAVPDGRLGTAGTGDVLSGMIGAFLAAGVDELWAAAMAAYVHGMASAECNRRGMMASDLLPSIPSVLDRLEMGP